MAVESGAAAGDVEATLARLVAEMGADDIETAAGCFATRGTLIIPRPDGDVRFTGRAEVARALTALHVGFSDLAYTPARRYLTPGGLIEEGVAAGRQTGRFAGAAAPGQTMLVDVRLLAEHSQRGQFRQLSVWADIPSLLVQIGAPVSGAEAVGAAISDARGHDTGKLRVTTAQAPQPTPAAPPAAASTSPRPHGRSRKRIGRLVAGGFLAGTAVVALLIVSTQLRHEPPDRSLGRPPTPTASAAPGVTPSRPAKP